MDRSVGLGLGGCHGCGERGFWGLSSGSKEKFPSQAGGAIAMVRRAAETVHVLVPDESLEYKMEIVFGGIQQPGFDPLNLKKGRATLLEGADRTAGDVAYRTFVCLGAVAEAGCPLMPSK